MEETCYRMISHVDGEIPVEEFNSILSEETLSSFPGTDKSKGIYGLDKLLEHTVHWIIFGAGIDIKEIGDWKQSNRVVYKNGFSPELIGKGLEKYKDHISDLSKYI